MPAATVIDDGGARDTTGLPPDLKGQWSKEMGDKFAKAMTGDKSKSPQQAIDDALDAQADAAFAAVDGKTKKPEEGKTDTKKADKTSAAATSALDDVINPDVSKKTAVAEADPVEEFKDDKSFNMGRAREVMGKLSSELKEARKQIEEATRTAKTGNPDLQAENERLKTQIQEMTAYVRAADITQDPEHRAKFIDGREKLMAKAIKRVEDAGGKGDDLREALDMKGKKRAEAIKGILSDLDEYDRGKVDRIIDDMDDLEEQRLAAIKDTGRAWEEIQASRKNQTAEQRRQADETTARELGEVAAELPKTFIFLRRAQPSAQDAEKWNADVDKTMQDAKFLLSGDAPLRDVASAVLQGLRATRIQEAFLAERKARLAAEEALKAYDGAEPGPGGHRQASGRSSGKEYVSPTTRFERIVAGKDPLTGE